MGRVSWRNPVIGRAVLWRYLEGGLAPATGLSQRRNRFPAPRVFPWKLLYKLFIFSKMYSI
jgi:hypothetical protein